MKKWVLASAAIAASALMSAPRADATVVAEINIARQVMNVYVDGELSYTWPVSTARRGYTTPHGSFRAQWLDPMHYSSQYEDAPMPYSVFFKGGYAIHGTYEVRHLGQAVSHGCVRLSPGAAETFYGLVEDQGLSHTHVVIH